jgi:hypothetical protein
MTAEQAAQMTPENVAAHSFISFGGFVYFDSSGHFLQLNALDPGTCSCSRAAQCPRVLCAQCGIAGLLTHCPWPPNRPDPHPHRHQSSGPGLYFSGPFPLPVVIKAELKAHGRVQPVSAGPIRESGAFNFAWINPNEEFTVWHEALRGACRVLTCRHRRLTPVLRGVENAGVPTHSKSRRGVCV